MAPSWRKQHSKANEEDITVGIHHEKSGRRMVLCFFEVNWCIAERKRRRGRYEVWRRRWGIERERSLSFWNVLREENYSVTECRWSGKEGGGKPPLQYLDLAISYIN